MNCPECLDLLQKRLDGEDPGQTPGWEEHLAQCAECREQFAAAGRLVEGLKLLVLPRPLPPATRKIIREVLADQRRRVQAGRVYVALALAASVLLAFLAWYQLLPWLTPPPDQGPGLIVEKPEPQPEPRIEPQAPSLQASMDEATDVVTSLTGRLVEKTVDRAKMLWTAAPQVKPLALASGTPWEEQLDPAAKSLQQASTGFSESVQTMTRTAQRAVEFFLKEIPGLERGS